MSAAQTMRGLAAKWREPLCKSECHHYFCVMVKDHAGQLDALADAMEARIAEREKQTYQYADPPSPVTCDWVRRELIGEKP
jgi:hypothetical protein